LPTPLPPTAISPGTSTEPGETIANLTPTLQWSAVPGADYYALAISKYPYGTQNIIYNSRQVYGTSHVVPSGILEYGQKYRWNMQAHNSGGWSAVSNTLYFQTPQALAPLAQIISQNIENIKEVFVDGEEYYIVTLQHYIDPETWETRDHSFFAKEPPAWIVYTYPNYQLVQNKELLRRIWTVDRANRLLARIGSSEGIQVDINTIDNVIGASEGLANADWLAMHAKLAIFMTMDLVIFAEIGAPISDYEILTVLSEEIGHYSDPVRFEMTAGRAVLELSRTNYQSAQQIAESHYDGISDYNTAKEYLNHYYEGYFQLQLGVDLALPAERILESPCLTIASWIPDYINHLGHKAVSLVSVWHKVASTTTQVAGIAKDINTAVDYVIELHNYIDNELNKIPENITTMFEHESFPVDYTLALSKQDAVSLYYRWGIHGIDEININLCSPAELRIYDSQGRITGLLGGEVRVEIPNSYYSYPSHSISIFFPDDSYVIEIEGTEDGVYGLEISSVDNGEVSSFVATDIPTAPVAVHRYVSNWAALAQGEEGVTLQIDADGDGTFEQTIEQVLALQGGQTVPGDYTVDAKTQTDIVVEKSGAGTPSIILARLLTNPGTIFTGDIGKYIDVYMPGSTNVDQIEVKLYYTDAEVAGFNESTLRLYWWNGSTWAQCSDSGVDIFANYIWARIRTDTTPTLSDLTGTPFGGGGEPNTPVGSPVTVNLPNAVVTFTSVTGEGATIDTEEAAPCGSLPSGLSAIGVTHYITTTATYTGPVTVGIRYDDSGITNENELKLFHCDGSSWHDVTTSVDTVNNIVYGQDATLSWWQVGGPGGAGGAASVPVFPNIYIGIAAALAAGVIAYLWRRRLVRQE
jgi:hypothetical protein